MHDISDYTELNIIFLKSEWTLNILSWDNKIENIKFAALRSAL